VDVIRQKMAIQDPALFLTCNLLEYRAKVSSDLPKHRLLAVPWDEYDVDLAIPF